jgi:hypothetical protein
MDEQREGDAQHMDEEEKSESKAELTEEQRTPPQAAQENAERFLEAKEEGKVPDECGTGAGSETARMLAEGEPLSESKIADIASFDRHRDNSDADVDEGESKWKDCGYSMWEAWGGNEGVDWAQEKNEMANEEKTLKVDFTVQEPEYTATSEGSWEAPAEEDFPDDYDVMTIFLARNQDSENYSDQSLPVVDYRNDEPTLVLEGLRSAHTVASRVDGMSDDEVEQVRSMAENLAEQEFDVMLEPEGDAQHMDEEEEETKNNISTMTDDSQSEEEPEGKSEDVSQDTGESGLKDEVAEIKANMEQLKETNESLKEENEDLKAELEDLKEVQDIKSELDEVKSLFEDVDVEDGARVPEQDTKSRDVEQDETKAEWKQKVDRMPDNYLQTEGKSKTKLEAFAQNHGIKTQEVEDYVSN